MEYPEELWEDSTAGITEGPQAGVWTKQNSHKEKLYREGDILKLNLLPAAEIQKLKLLPWPRGRCCYKIIGT